MMYDYLNKKIILSWLSRLQFNDWNDLPIFELTVCGWYRFTYVMYAQRNAIALFDKQLTSGLFLE